VDRGAGGGTEGRYTIYEVYAQERGLGQEVEGSENDNRATFHWSSQGTHHVVGDMHYH
jgi:hypothetical protein